MIGFLEQRLLSIYKKYRKTIIVFPLAICGLFYITAAFTTVTSKKKQVNQVLEKDSIAVAVTTEVDTEKPRHEAAPTAPEALKYDTSESKSKPVESSTTVTTREIIEEEIDSDIVVYTPSVESVEKMTRPIRSARVKVLGKQTLSTSKPFLRLVLLEPFQFGSVKMPKGSDVFAKATFIDEGVRLNIHQIKIEQKLYDTNMVVLGQEGFAVFPTQGKAKVKFTNEAMTIRLEK